MKFIHSADWQLGARFAQFGEKAGILRKARLETLERTLRKANEEAVDAVLIAGDLFEDNQVDDSVITSALEKFALYPHLPVFVLPGNHDPANGPASIWNRRPLRSKPPNLTVLDIPYVLECAGAHLIAVPLHQKVSTIDPSLKVAEFAGEIDDDRIRIGITHGSLAIPGRHQSNDFPIALDAATRAGLDYLAVGHWHNWQVHDGGKLIMPGTPEPDQFDQAGAGFVALVEIGTKGTIPKVSQIPVATLNWKVLDIEVSNVEVAKHECAAALAELCPSAESAVIQIRLRGAASPPALASMRDWLESALEPFAVWQISDLSSPAFTAAELDELRLNHPLLAQAVLDLAQIEHLATNAEQPAGIDATKAISLRETQQILASARIELSKLDPDFFRTTKQLLLQALSDYKQ